MARSNWHQAAQWYDKLVGDKGSDYHQNLIIPGALRLLAPRRGEMIIDVACGQGVFCRELSKSGAVVTGIDSAKGLIKAARKRSLEIKYHLANAEDLSAFGPGSFDAASCLMAVQNIENYQAALKAIGRTVKQHGRLLLVMSHPCFRVPRQSSWGFDEQRDLQYRRIDGYLSELKVPIQMQPGYDPHLYTLSFHRPLGAYVKALNAAGLAVTALEEWPSHRQSKPGKRSKAENRARKEIPLFMALLAVKK